MDKQDKDRKRLSDSIDRYIKSLQKQILDISELVVPPTNWKAFRSKILGISNDIRRDLVSEIDLNYTVQFTPKTISEDIIEIKSSKFQSLNYKAGAMEDNGKHSKDN